jgi:hypothetical protein
MNCSVVKRPDCDEQGRNELPRHDEAYAQRPWSLNVNSLIIMAWRSTGEIDLCPAALAECPIIGVNDGVYESATNSRDVHDPALRKVQ